MLVDDPSFKTLLPRRLGVGIMLVNAQGEVFVARRIDDASRAWQMPQGGVDPGEEPRAAAFRELQEETGITSAHVLSETSEWLSYDLPASLLGVTWGGRYRGQAQKWFLLRFTGLDSEINLATEHPEFEAWRWHPLERLPKDIVAFKRDLYEAVCVAFAPIIRA